MSESLPELPDFCWPTDTSCVSWWDEWEIEPDPGADPPVVGVPRYSDAEKAVAVALAGQTMRLLTAYRVGGCPVTIRPCRPGCSEATWRTYPVAGGSGSTPWQPVQLGGTWLNIGCGHLGGCGCSTTAAVQLSGLASSIVAVTVDGEVLDPSQYRLEPSGLLFRTDGEAWPLCQDMNAPDTEPGTWSVAYVPGAAVDGLGAMAAGLLAGQYVKACSGGDCDLPRTVTQVVRNGVTKTLSPGAFPGGRTGIQFVDTYLERWNPQGWKGNPVGVYSPDLDQQRFTELPGGYPIPYGTPIISGGGV